MLRLFAIPFLALCLVQLSLAAQVPLGSAPHTAEKWEYEICDIPTIIDIHSIKVSPDPPKPGENLTVTVNGRATERVEDGAYADVTVKLGLIKLLQKEFDICEEARNANASIQCPIEEGEYTVSHTVALPKEIPKAKFVVNVQGYTADDEDLVCLTLKVDFMRRPFFKW